MPSPLCCERPAQLNDSRFRGIVAALLLGEIDNAAGHGRNKHDGSTRCLLDHLSTACLCGQESAGQVDVYQAAKHRVIVILGLDI